MFILFFYFTGFCSIIILSFFNNVLIRRALITLLIFSIFVISSNLGIGGDLENYERYFYGIKFDGIVSGTWLNDYLKILIKVVFNESNLQPMPLKVNPEYDFLMQQYLHETHFGFLFYKFLTHTIFILGAFSLINSTSYSKETLVKILVLLLPVTMTFMTSSIEQSLSLGLVFLALSKIKDSKLYFISIIVMSGFIHWSSWIFILIVFYESKNFLRLLFLILSLVVALEILDLSLPIVVQSFFIFLNNFFEITYLDIFIDNLSGAIMQKGNERNISWHHIYLSSALVLFSLISYIKFRPLLNSKNRNKSILLISILVLLLVLSFIFKDTDNYIVRLSAIIKIISLICFTNAIYCIKKNTQLINISFGFIFAALGIYSFY